MLVSKNAKIGVTPNAKPLMRQWNIGCVGSLIFDVGHVHFMLFVTQHKPSLQWNMGFNLFPFHNNCLIHKGKHIQTLFETIFYDT